MARRFATRIGVIRANRFAQIDPQKNKKKNYPCPSFPCFFGKTRGKPPKKQGFFIPTEPLKSLEKKGKTLKKTRNSSQGKKTRKSKKKQRKDRDFHNARAKKGFSSGTLKRFARIRRFAGKAAQCRQKVCSSKRPPKLEPRSVRPNEVFENLVCRISPE